MDTMRDDLVHALHGAGYDEVEIRIVLSPAWTTDWMTARGRAQLAAAGIAPPSAVTTVDPGAAIPLTLRPTRSRLACPQCGSRDTVESSRYGATACKSLHRCRACGEPFEHFKEL
jgi:ring-1,2-phenylacetyl-CoA epoxidase subunit PaaD